MMEQPTFCGYCGELECRCKMMQAPTPGEERQPKRKPKKPKALTGLKAQMAIINAICRAIERDK